MMKVITKYRDSIPPLALSSSLMGLAMVMILVIRVGSLSPLVNVVAGGLAGTCIGLSVFFFGYFVRIASNIKNRRKDA